ncbi:MAG: metal ABC transporter ATP-binding protein [Anaerolineae bacterium]|nr:metal ABC transporter ATP-binding protein [Anaerolineae bacterium]MCX8067420.1 metal ABC transporter ATP-binding protein [Anaerolineae bacterium]MDW7991162.1 metal ABC transporter ATP-binding protein [Anaerolineae bacterium]
MAECEALRVESLSVTYNGRTALEDVTFSVQEGERVAVVGPNGAGKSTLFRVIVGLLVPEQGRVEVFGCDPFRRRVPVGYVPQREDVDLSFPVTVADVVMMGRVREMGWLRWPSQRDREVVRQALEEVGLLQLADRRLDELSGGQLQRTFIARALAQQAPLLLMDEPFAGVDAASEEAILELLDRLQARGVTVLLATHDLTLAASRFDRVLLLNTRIIAYGPPGEALCPATLQRAYGGQLAIWEHERGLMLVGDVHCSGGRR